MSRNETQPNLFTLILLLFLIILFYFPLGCAVGASSASTSSPQQQQTAASTGILPAQFFGMVVRNPGTQPLLAAGARRLSDPSVTWAALEPTAGTFDWSTLDQEVALAHQSGAQITLTLGITPTWAAGTSGASLPADLATWDTYIQAVATRYQGKIAAYELWNAPEDPANWTGDPAQLPTALATLAAHAAADLATADPAAQLVSPALSATTLAQFVNAGGAAFVQVIGASLITANQPPEAMPALLQSIRSALAGSAAAGLPVWNDQQTWQLPGQISAAQSASGSTTTLDPATQAAWLARALILNAGYGVQRLQWYAWDNHTPGTLTLTDQNNQPTPAALAYASVQSWLQGAQLNGCSQAPNGLYTCQLVRQSATGTSTQWILWSPNATLEASALGATTATSLTGTQTPIDPSGMVSTGPSPILLQ
jgi:hypothetical protein